MSILRKSGYAEIYNIHLERLRDGGRTYIWKIRTKLLSKPFYPVGSTLPIIYEHKFRDNRIIPDKFRDFIDIERRIRRITITKVTLWSKVYEYLKKKWL